MNWRQRIRAVVDGDGPLMVYQPIYRLADNRRVGWEALARFPEDRLPAGAAMAGLTDERGLGFGPEVWFAAADTEGLGVHLEVSAIAAALRQLPELPPEDYLAVNVGPETLVAGRLGALVADVDLSRVVVELTEHLAIRDYGAVRSAVLALQADHSAKLCTKIPGIAADDMGAGTASLRHLLELREVLDYCKLDLSLTAGIDTDQGRQQLAVAIVGIGASAGFKVVAEGVETPTQLATLRSLGVYAGQGYLLGRPGPLPQPPPA